MNITTQITEKDKRLLVLLAVFILCVGFGWFLIRPAIQDIEELNTAIALAESNRRELEHKIDRIPQLEEQAVSDAAQLAEASGELFDFMESQEIDSFMTLRALSFGFAQSDLRQLTIQSPDSWLSFPSYLMGESKEEQEELPGIYAALVSFTLQGNRARLEAYADRLMNEEPSIQLKGFSWHLINVQDLETGEISDTYQLTVELYIFMTDNALTTDTVTGLLGEDQK